MQTVGDVAQAQGEASPHVRYHHGLNLPNYRKRIIKTRNKPKNMEISFNNVTDKPKLTARDDIAWAILIYACKKVV